MQSCCQRESLLHRPDSGAGSQVSHNGHFPLRGNSASPLSLAGKTSGLFCPFCNTPFILSPNTAHGHCTASASGCTGRSARHVAPSPTIAIALCLQPDISPGYCWPVQASQSQVVIRLPTQVRPSAITVQHPLKTSVLMDISSAPQDFTVFVSLCQVLGAGAWCWGKAIRGTRCSLHIC